jgi:hypothetical protein
MRTKIITESSKSCLANAIFLTGKYYTAQVSTRVNVFNISTLIISGDLFEITPSVQGLNLITPVLKRIKLHN